MMESIQVRVTKCYSQRANKRLKVKTTTTSSHDAGKRVEN